MTMSAIAFMVIVWSAILLNTGYCFYKLLTSEKQLGSDE